MSLPGSFMPLSDARLPVTLYSADQCRELDRIAIEEQGIPSLVLMKRAGRAAYQALLATWPNPSLITVFCGSGNNAGDGYVVAALAAQQRVPVRIIQVGDAARLKGDAAKACAFARQAGVDMQAWNGDVSLTDGVIVDALLGTGARGAPRGDYVPAIQAINASALPVLAVDLPSGLDADTGYTPGACIRADVTVTFIGLKRGLFTGRAPALAGRVHFNDLAVPQAVYAAVASSVERLTFNAVGQWLKPRPADVHKGHFGHVLVIGGELGTVGAALMAAESAARVGAGLVSVATRPEHCVGFLARRPELMVHGITSTKALEPLIEKASVIVIGPGLGQSDWSRQLLAAALNSRVPLVVDADALNLISRAPATFAQRGQWILTPHPGEAARLLNCSAKDIQADRFGAAANLQATLGGAVVLKGAGSLVASSGPNGVRIAVADVGNPGMASGGMGDVLSGILGGLLAQQLDLTAATEVGVLLHGKAADLAAREGGERGLLATDLLPFLRELVNPQ
jgi:ADP-dependent NAD(P)H-hydrate dehydratase / NAD(P)H-hydrate epimerase